MISTCTKDFSWENSPSFQIKKNPNHHSLMINNFLKGSQEYKINYIYSQIWLNYFLADHHLGYNKKKKP
jgi:hypothetical protein